MSTNQFPRDLADAVSSVLKTKASRRIKPELLTELFEAMYFASLKTEESQPIAFHAVYIDPKDPDPAPPERIVKDRWSYVKLSKPIRATISNLIKIAKASDSRTSSLAIFPDSNGRLAVWGFIDQGNRYHDFVNHDLDSAPERPGIFQASVMGIGHLVAYSGLWKIAELRNNRVLREFITANKRSKQPCKKFGERFGIASLRRIKRFRGQLLHRLAPRLLLVRERRKSPVSPAF
jgi:hypothetical protein